MDNLITLYRHRLNLQNAMFTRVDHEDAMVAIVFKVTQPDGIEQILKISTLASHFFCEFYFLKYFKGLLPVPGIMNVVEPEKDTNGAILMEYLPGTLLQTSDFTDGLAYEIGSLLARIHSNRVEGYGDLTQPLSLRPDPGYYFTLKFEEGITECSHHLPAKLLEQCRRYYDANINLLTFVDGPCITHRDFRPGNVIINEGKIQGIIDWAGGRASFAEEDFCPMEFGEWPASSIFKKAFFEGYVSIRPVPDYYAVMPLLRLSRAIATIGFTVKSGTWENKNGILYQRNRQFLQEFLI